jgi:hypothetical protein
MPIGAVYHRFPFGQRDSKCGPKAGSGYMLTFPTEHQMKREPGVPGSRYMTERRPASGH